VNAAGRLGHQQSALRLLTTGDRREAAHLARQLEEDNRLRRRLADQVVRDARCAASAAGSTSALVVASDRWHPAVLGIAAARLLDEDVRPIALIVWKGDEGKGSVRSPAGFDVHAILAACGDVLVDFGGHAR